MNTKPNFNMSSRLLISTLIATSFFMVNCNKGSDKKGVKVQTTANGKTTVDPKKQKSGSEGVEKTADLKACTAAILKSYQILFPEADRVLKKQNENAKAESAEKLSADYNQVLLLCDDLGKEFEKENMKTCKYPNPKNKTINEILPKFPVQCLKIGDALNKEDGTVTVYSKQVNDQKAIAETKANNSEEFKNLKLLMSEEMKSMLKQENLNFKKYIVDGEIKSDADEMQKAFTDKKVVCSFTETSTEVPATDKVFLNIADYSEADVQNMPEGIRGLGLAMVVSTEKPSDISATIQKLGCSHLSKDKIDIKLLKKALGNHLISEAELKKTILQQTAAAAEQKAKDDFRKEEHKQY